MRPDGSTRPHRPAGPRVARRRLLTLLAPTVLVAACAWVLTGYSAIVDARVVALEVVATVVVLGGLLLAPTPHGRRAMALLSAYVVLTLAGDAYWLLSVDPSGLSYTLGEFEPGFTVAVEIVRYVALAALLAHAVPRSGRGTWPGSRRSDAGAPRAGWLDGRAPAVLQAATGTAALVLLLTPAGDLVGDGQSYSVFSFFDVVVAATAVAVVLSTLSSQPRPTGRQQRRSIATATGVSGLVVGDAVMVLSQTRAWTLGGALGVSLAVGGATVLLLTHVLAAPHHPAPVRALPPVPGRARPWLSTAATVLVQHVLPLLIAVSTTAAVVAADTEVGPVTIGTAAAAVVLSLLHSGARVVRAHHDEHQAAAAGRDELTGAHTRRAFTALARRFAPVEPAGGGTGWSVALLDLDGFKAVNDTFGHEAGDHVLRLVAQRAAGVLDGHGVLARFGGDEFVALLGTGSPAAPATADLLRRVAEAVTAPVVLPGGAVIGVGVSVGVAALPARGSAEDLTAALKLADQRMYTDKHRHRA